jgi:hypothetical protein
VDHAHCLTVRLAFALHGADDAEVIEPLRHLGEQIAAPQSRFAMLLKLPRRSEQLRLARGGWIEVLRRRKGQLFAIHLLELRFVIKRVHLRRPAVHEQEDDALRPRCVMQPARQTRRRGDAIQCASAPNPQAAVCKAWRRVQ